MNRIHRTDPSPHPSGPRRTAGVTVGALLGILAVVAVLVIVLMLVWRPGAAPVTDPEPSAPAAVEDPGNDEAPEDPLDAEGLGEAPEGEPTGPAAGEDVDDEAPGAADGAAEAPEGEAPAEDAPAEDGQPEEARAGDAQAAAEEGEADADAAPEDAAAEGAEGAEGEAAEPVDATVEPEEEPAVRTDPMQRVAEMGGDLESAAESVTNAIDATEERLRDLEPEAPSGEEEPALDLPAPSEAPDEGRVRGAEVPNEAASERVGSARPEVRATRAAESTAPDVDVATAPAEEESPRVRAVSVGGAGAVTPGPVLEALRTRPERTEARVDLAAPSPPAEERESARVRSTSIETPTLPSVRASRPATEASEAEVDVGSSAPAGPEGESPRVRTLSPSLPSAAAPEARAAAEDEGSSGATVGELDGARGASGTEIRTRAADVDEPWQALERIEENARESLEATTEPADPPAR